MFEGLEVAVTDPNWTRGDAAVKNGVVILRKTEPYSIDSVDPQDVVFGFAAIRTPRDAAAFAGRYGLLRTRGEGREPYAAWEQDAGRFRWLIILYGLLQRSAVGEPEALVLLRQAWIAQADHFFPEPVGDDQDLFRRVSSFISATVTAGLEGDSGEEITGIKLAPGSDPGGFALSARPANLRGLLYFGLAEQFFTRVTIRECEQCGKPFPVHDPRQRFCSDACANRARYERRVQRQQTET